MVTARAGYRVLSVVPGKAVLIEDVGPWDRRPTVTNDAEAVVRDLTAQLILRKGMRLFYYDSERNLDEIIVRDDGAFVGFAPGPVWLRELRHLPGGAPWT